MKFIKYFAFTVFVLAPAACGRTETYNPGDPATREHLVTNLLRCAFHDGICLPRLECPSGYTLVGPDSAVDTTNDFCVSQFEMKLEASGVIDSTGNFANAPFDSTWIPRSVAEGQPWVWLTRAEAVSACANLGARYHLITNPEWMTVAREIENNAANWSMGVVGFGVVSRGWTHTSNTAAAPSTDANCLYNTGGNTCGAAGDHLYKRTNTLAAGGEIWDFAGNVWSWVDWDVTPANKAYFSTDTQPLGLWREWPQIDVNISAGNEMETKTWQSLNTALNSTNGIGQYYAGDNATGGGVLRGADWGDEEMAGIYSVSLATAASGSDATFSFRCVYQ